MNDFNIGDYIQFLSTYKDNRRRLIYKIIGSESNNVYTITTTDGRDRLVTSCKVLLTLDNAKVVPKPS